MKWEIITLGEAAPLQNHKHHYTYPHMRNPDFIFLIRKSKGNAVWEEQGTQNQGERGIRKDDGVIKNDPSTSQTCTHYYVQLTYGSNFENAVYTAWVIKLLMIQYQMQTGVPICVAYKFSLNTKGR